MLTWSWRSLASNTSSHPLPNRFLGLILAVTLNPLVKFFERLKIPRFAGTTLLMAALLCGMGAATLSLRTQVEGILDQIPDAAAKLSAALRDMASQANTMAKVQEAAQLTRASRHGASPERELALEP